jgi:hypothetical protein
MEVLVDYVQVREPLKECTLEVCVHVAGDCLHLRHPLSEHKVAEFMHDLPPLGMDKPQHMARLKIDDHGGAAAAIVQLERICAQIPCLPLRLPERPFAAFSFRVEPRKPCPVDGLDHILVEPCRERYRLEGLPQGKEVLREGERRQCDSVAWDPEGHPFRECAPALPACSSWPQDLYPRPSHPQREVPEHDGVFPFFSIALPQQGHEGASFASSLPGTDRMRTAFLHPLVDVLNFSVRALSLGFPVCTRPSRYEGIWMKPGAAILPAWGNDGQLGCRGCYTCHRGPSFFGVYMLRCKILEDGRFPVCTDAIPQASAHSF